MTEPHMTYDVIEKAFDAWRKTLTVVDRPSNQEIFGQGYVAGWNAKENVAEECAKIAESHSHGTQGDPNAYPHEISYDEACRDIAKAIRDIYAHE